ncbi:MAG: PFL family protein [Clostridia bacterium]|nr:PFL family protein [Selenomonadales bacterium]MBP3645966.1 PFL family protein [Clostridia bacterium]
MIEVNEILQTMQMIREQHFDIRTITMGISLLSCKKNTDRETAEAVYEKVTRLAKNLVRVGNQLESELGVPIVNKRISVTPVSMISGNDPMPIAVALDKAAQEVGVNFIGGFGALMHKGSTRSEEILLEAMPEVFAKTERLCGSVNVGSTRSGINMDAVRKMGHVIKKTAELTADTDAFGCAKIVVFCNAVEDNPFMAGAFHGVGEPECVVNVGVSGPGVVQRALAEVHGQPFDVLAETIKRTAFKITRVGELVAQEAAKRLGVPFGIVDLSLAPTPARGDSVAYVLSEMGLEMAGAPGTIAALAMLNDMVKKGGVMASSHVGGLSGAFIPVSEDIGMIEAAAAGCLTLEKMEAMTCVCSVGLDMIAIPGDTSANTIAGIIADEAAIGMVNNKTTAVRVIPAPGKKAGDSVNFGGLFGFAPIMNVNSYCNDEFIERGGRIPAPLHSLRN